MPPPGWAGHYIDALEAGWDFATAGCVKLSLERTRALTIERIAAGDIGEVCTAEERARFRTIHRREIIYRWLRKAKKPKILGGNWAATRASIVAVNGFDEKFDGFGKEGSDIRNRLRNSGFRGRSLWDRNWVFHCSHDLDPRRTLPPATRSLPDHEYYRSRRRATT